jgi:hypothetical protein
VELKQRELEFRHKQEELQQKEKLSIQAKLRKMGVCCMGYQCIRMVRFIDVQVEATL